MPTHSLSVCVCVCFCFVFAHFPLFTHFALFQFGLKTIFLDLDSMASQSFIVYVCVCVRAITMQIEYQTKVSSLPFYHHQQFYNWTKLPNRAASCRAVCHTTITISLLRCAFIIISSSVKQTFISNCSVIQIGQFAKMCVCVCVAIINHSGNVAKTRALQYLSKVSRYRLPERKRSLNLSPKKKSKTLNCSFWKIFEFFSEIYPLKKKAFSIFLISIISCTVHFSFLI